MSDDDFEPHIEEDAQQDNAADVAGVKRKQTRVRADKLEAEEFWRKTFASEVGRREMWGLLQAAGVMAERFGAGPNGFPDPYATFFRAGVQSVSDHYLREWQIRDYAGVYLMLCEHHPRYPKPPKAKS